MTTSKPLFTPSAKGIAYDISPAGLMLILADMVYGPQVELEWTGGPNVDATIRAMLEAARAGGYTQTDILYTLLVRGERSKRIELMACAACAAAGNDRLIALFERLGLAKK